MLGGGWLVGRVDNAGAFTGTDIAFLYPDLSTALVGEWRDGQLVAGCSARLTGLQEVHGVLVPSFTISDSSSDNHYERWISTDLRMLCPPHRQDPYESTLVRVAKSEVEGGGEGLYARKNIPAGTLIAYYNGIRMTKEQRTPYGDTGYAIFVEWAERGRRTGDHMDLPPEVRHSARVFIPPTGILYIPKPIPSADNKNCQNEICVCVCVCVGVSQGACLVEGSVGLRKKMGSR